MKEGSLMLPPMKTRLVFEVCVDGRVAASTYR